MLKSIRTKGLYNRYDYYFNFLKNKMTIIAGPNGFGKTTILNIIHDVLDDDLYSLTKIPFSEIELETDDNKKLLFVKENNALFMNGERLYVPTNINFNQNQQLIFSLSQDDLIDIKSKYNKVLSFQQELMVGTLIADSAGGFKTSDYLIRINSQIVDNPKPKCLLELLDFYRSVGNSIFCGADRLYRDYGINDGARIAKDRYSNVIETLSKKLNNTFSKYYGNYTQLSNELDFRFISRLNEEIQNKSVYTQNDYQKDKEESHNRMISLVNNGVIVKDVYHNKNLRYNEEYSLAFKVFYDNLKTKLNLLEKITNKMELFTKLINAKLANKEVSLINPSTKAREISVKDGNNIIPLTGLSSGEKELIVLYFKLIFEESSNLIALIDEPELSTHISWQYEALDDFEKIMEVNDSLKQIIVCTHSPQIVNNRWESTIDLFDEANKQQ